jgi:serine/threonine protein kinase
MSNQIVGNYLRLEKIGKGGFAKVYKAQHVHDGSLAVFKIMEKQDSKLANSEVSVLNKLERAGSHPNIVKLISQHYNDRFYCLILEYCEGGDLAKVLEQQRLTVDECRHIFCGIVQGLLFLFRNKMLHRDLKPANIFLTSREVLNATAKIGDFGFSRSVKPGDSVSRAGGTECYESPERLREEKYGFESEVWAAGAILYEMLTGKKLVSTVAAKTQLILKQPPNVELLETVDSAAADLVRRMLQVNPSDRIHIEEVPRHEWLTNTSKQKSTVAVATSPLRPVKEQPSSQQHWDPAEGFSVPPLNDVQPPQVPALSAQSRQEDLRASFGAFSQSLASDPCGLVSDVPERLSEAFAIHCVAMEEVNIGKSIVLLCYAAEVALWASEGPSEDKEVVEFRRCCLIQAMNFEKLWKQTGAKGRLLVRSPPEIVLSHVLHMIESAANEELIGSIGHDHTGTYQRAAILLRALLRDPSRAAWDADVLRAVLKRVEAVLQ